VRHECTTKSLNESTANPSSCIYLTAWLYGKLSVQLPDVNGNVSLAQFQSGMAGGNGGSLGQGGGAGGGSGEGGIDDAMAAYHPGVLGDDDGAGMLSDDEPAGKKSNDDDEDF
jgi:hypothetical protein